MKKTERLSDRAALAAIFSAGRYGSSDGMKYCFRAGNGLAFNRMAVSVPKRLFRRAVKRNMLKRRIREAYRCNKALLPIIQEAGGTDILFIYNTKEVRDFRAVTAAVICALSAMARQQALPAAGQAGSSI